MITSWNVRGLNKDAKHREVNSFLYTVQVPIVALLETIVKQINAERIRKSFGSMWNFIDNYSHHHNGRIWLLWKSQEVNIRVLQVEEQYIHIEVLGLDNRTCYLATIVYAYNQLERRLDLWKQIDSLGSNVTIPWIVLGDYNNVRTCQDRIGGNPVSVKEYRDLDDMMQRLGLFEAPTRGCHFTWSNKQSSGVIYSRIDRVIGNVQWFQTFQDVIVEVLPPGISDHSPIRVSCLTPQAGRRTMFKFINCVTRREGFQDVVRYSWCQQAHGTAMHRLWVKLKRLQAPLRPLHKNFTGIQIQIQQARQDLIEAQQNLQTDLFDGNAIDSVKVHTNTLLELHRVEEEFLRQKAKIDWLNLGDGN
ncbi:uncharacterized protein LOC131605555 [Vicia villosa]|uniref:uncharacterized protein LOC131605555 n=1 Tax=Vicia villosa TaxID=3911 RepID=UPI00273B9E46|nr:uncharacterized protein LOC131605555 [Vicia villosa]